MIMCVVPWRGLWCFWSSNLDIHLPALPLEGVCPPWLILSSTFSADLPRLPYFLVTSSFSRKREALLQYYSFDLAYVYIHACGPRHVMFLSKCVRVLFFFSFCEVLKGPLYYFVYIIMAFKITQHHSFLYSFLFTLLLSLNTQKSYILLLAKDRVSSPLPPCWSWDEEWWPVGWTLNRSSALSLPHQIWLFFLARWTHPWGATKASHSLFPWQHTCHHFQNSVPFLFLNHDSPTSVKPLCHRLFHIVSYMPLLI